MGGAEGAGVVFESRRSRRRLLWKVVEGGGGGDNVHFCPNLS